MKKLTATLIFPALALTGCFTEEKSIIPSTSCAIDAPALNAVVPVAQPFAVGGWAYDKIGNNRIAPEVKIQLASTTRDVLKTFEAKPVKRADVAQAFNDPKLEGAGFSAEVPANSVNPGIYEVTILQEFQNSVVACGAGHTIQVK